MAEPLEAVALVPEAAALTSNGELMSRPAYSSIRISGKAAGVLNFTVTVFAPAAAAAMLRAK
jgi:hypothetical protein